MNFVETVVSIGRGQKSRRFFSHLIKTVLANDLSSPMENLRNSALSKKRKIIGNDSVSVCGGSEHIEAFFI